MKERLFINIKELVGVQQESALKIGPRMDELNGIKEAFLYIKDGKIAGYGPMSQMPQELKNMAENAVLGGGEVVDATGRFIIPAFCDSHTHLVYAGSREQEFTDKIKGLSYQEIARRGGGILNSAKLLSQTSEDALFKSAYARAQEIMSQGTGAVEIKSGYGLTPQDEIKMLRVIARLKEATSMTVKATFLGAHAFPARYADDHNGYVEEIINEMIPMVAAEGLAEYIDAFCEDGFFSVEDTDRIFNAGIKYGLRPKVHANQMGFSGGVQLGVKYGARSVDHLESTGPDEFNALKDSDTIATILPGATFFLNMQYAPARQLIDYGIPVAMASNYNPGSCPSGSLQFQMALACIAMKLTPAEALNACTINGAFAMDVDDILGGITVGKQANVILTKEIPSIDFIPYAFTTPFLERLYIAGEEM